MFTFVECVSHCYGLSISGVRSLYEISRTHVKYWLVELYITGEQLQQHLNVLLDNFQRISLSISFLPQNNNNNNSNIIEGENNIMLLCCKGIPSHLWFSPASKDLCNGSTLLYSQPTLIMYKVTNLFMLSPWFCNVIPLVHERCQNEK